MNRKELVLASLAAGEGASYTPVQVQKMFFLIDRNIADLIGGPQFDFQPYNYGPFDKAVYETLEQLCSEDFVRIVPGPAWRNYLLTLEGQTAGERLLQAMPEKASKYIRAVSDFVRSLSFTQLVLAIYEAYPEMRANSVFQEPA